MGDLDHGWEPMDMKHTHILSKAAEGDSGSTTPSTTDFLISVFSVLMAMANILLQRKNLTPTT